MVIERALEKLRQTAATKAAIDRPASREPAKPSKPSAAPQAPEVRPTFPKCQCDPAAVAAHRILLPDAPLTENERVVAAYRMIRTRLLHLSRTNSLRSIAVTSPGPGDGKSLTSINLALSLARDPLTSVFLIDLDMRNPSICRYLGVQPPVDLLSYFTGDRKPSDVFFSVGTTNLAIAGGLTSTELASELLSSGKLEALLSYVSSTSPNPIILLDLPPVLVTDEALLVAPKVDATLLVVSEGKTRRESLARAMNMLAEFKSVGVVLNRATEATANNAYYYDYR
jgi:capsular exopolysaccharide synthesis family protein